MNDFTERIRGFFHVVAEFSTELLNFVHQFKFCLRNMKKSKRIFVAVGILFIIATILVGYDISRKTSFPGSKKYLKESIAPTEEQDSTKTEDKLEDIKP